MVNIVEKVGSGIERMRNAMKQINLPLPEFQFTEFFTIIFKRPIIREKTSEKILALIANNKNITIEEIANLTNRTTRTIEMNIAKLKILRLRKSDFPRIYAISSHYQLRKSGDLESNVNKLMFKIIFRTKKGY